VSSAAELCDVSTTASAYAAHAKVLLRIAVRKFRIDPSDAETLVHDVFLSFILHEREIRDVRSWLVGAICNASRHFHRRFDRLESLPEHFEPAIQEHTMEQVVANECLGRLTARCSIALRLRYVEGYTVAEIAEELGTTPKYAEKILRNCLREATKLYEVEP
jgi:RNA polymerase sigma factor (sigma-70 family)